ncbi:MAG: hypothetical protein GX783_00910 [Clostridiales bacterium]|nr:hypothetical protein [Clostridiales bacterium]
MVQLRIKLLISVALFCAFSAAIGQGFEIPEGKFEVYWEKSFLDKCRKASSELPFKVETPTNNCRISMDYGNLFGHVAVPFILDGDTTLRRYTKIEYDEDTGKITNKYRTSFSFQAIGFFEYKDYWIIVYSYPLADPNIYQSYTVNTYTKDGKRIDRLPFFKWECKLLPVMDVSWFEMTGYIDDEFEITIQTRGSWSDVNTGIYTGEALEEKKKQHYRVYHINDEGRFELVNKEPKYVVDEKNNWTCNQ